MLAAGRGTSVANNRWGTGFYAIGYYGSSLAESILQYAERAMAAEGKVSELEGRLSALEMATNIMPTQT